MAWNARGPFRLIPGKHRPNDKVGEKTIAPACQIPNIRLTVLRKRRNGEVSRQ